MSRTKNKGQVLEKKCFITPIIWEISKVLESLSRTREKAKYTFLTVPQSVYSTKIIIMTVNITTDFIRKIFKYWESVKLIVADTGFPKVWIFTWKPEFCHWQPILLAIFLEVTGSFHSFERKCLPNSQACERTVCLNQFFFQVKMVFNEKK